MPDPQGKPVMTTAFVGTNLLHDVITGRSCTGIIHLLNKTQIDWFSKRQNTVETATDSATMPSGNLLKHQNILNFHRIRETQAAGFINFVHIDGKHNPADSCAKHTLS
eukprot:4812690-Ditylum_brightwellii.AAC.1